MPTKQSAEEKREPNKKVKVGEKRLKAKERGAQRKLAKESEAVAASPNPERWRRRPEAGGPASRAASGLGPDDLACRSVCGGLH
ncbi:MAG: hypothetical protein LBU32_23705 [Clostridiales bacterium]|nr:hypothetical protein [Clostridiales bacterium]